jgi:hypothetical protein
MSRFLGVKKESGEVMVETVLSLGLMAVIVLGFAQQYMVSIDKMHHEQVIAQLSLGPQLASLSYTDGNPATSPPTLPGFAPLSASTNPSLQQFADTIGNFFLAIDGGRSALFITLGYLTVQENTGAVTGKQMAGQGFRYGGQPGGECEQNENAYLSQLNQFGDDKLEIMRTTNFPPVVTPGATPVSVPVVPGIKIYDVKIGTSVLRSYITLIPYIFVTLCSEPRSFIFPQTPLTSTIISPRGHAN